MAACIACYQPTLGSDRLAGGWEPPVDRKRVDKTRLAATFANFKKAMGRREEAFMHTHANRRERYQQFEERAAACDFPDERALAERLFFDRESLGVRRMCRQWRTEDFVPLRVLGEGAFGVVHLVKRRETGEHLALKQVEKAHYQAKNRERAYMERDALVEIRSRWFADLYATFQDARYVYMVMEFVPGGDFVFYLQRRGRLLEEETRFYMAELVEALDAVHRHGFVHRDVKPDNIMLTSSGHLKLLDFGLCRQERARSADAARDCGSIAAAANARLPDATARYPAAAPSADGVEQMLDGGGCHASEHVSSTADASTGCEAVAQQVPVVPRVGAAEARARLRSVVGTPHYMAPEAWSGRGGPEVDLWALGVVTFECLCGLAPFHTGKPEEDGGPKAARAIRKQIEHWAEIMPRRYAKTRERGYLNDVSERLLSRLICAVDHRLTAQSCRSEPFFEGVDFRQVHLATPPLVPANRAKSADAVEVAAQHFDPQHRTSVLPPSGPGFLRDAPLEWAHYDFDIEAHELQSAKCDVESFFLTIASL